jgi:HAD superfamily hydrolase (TIGR01509 family)
MDVRVARVLARLRGMAAPSPEASWDDGAARTRSTPDEVARVLAAYSDAFIASMPPTPGAAALIARLAQRHTVAILSNWPLASTIDRYAEAAGWAPHLSAIVVSQRVGTIKPHPAMFAAARVALGNPESWAILHVGDDWAADVEGAKAAGWRAAWLSNRPADSPLPGSARTASVTPDLELASLADLEPGLERLAARRR